MLVKPLVRPIVRAIAGNPTASLGSGFSPTSLFADGSKGVVYDNNDLSSFYLDSNGVTPATVNGLVGLQLDKSANLALGAEFLTNGSFTSWTGDNPDGWSLNFTENATNYVTQVGGGVRFVCDNVTAATEIRQGTLLANTWYRLEVVVPSFTAGGVNVGFVGGTGTAVLPINAAGTYVAYIMFNSSTALAVRRIGVTDLVIGSISVKELPGNHRYQTTTGSKPVLRGTPTGSNLVTNGDFASGTGWTVNSGWAIGSGTLNATAVTAGYGKAVFAGATITAGKVYRITYTITAISAGAVCVSLGATASYTVGTARGAVGTYVEYITAGFNGAVEFERRTSDFTGSIDNVEVVDVSAGQVTAPYGLQYDGVDDFLQTAAVDFATATSDGLARRNLLTFPSAFDDAFWLKLNASVTANSVVSPDGTTTADTVTSTSSASNTTGVYKGQIFAAGHTMSIYAKANTSSIAWLSSNTGESYGVFNLSSGTVIDSGNATASITSVGGGWYRLTVANTTVGGTFIISGGKDTYTTGHPWANGTWTSGNSIYLWGIQLEVGSTASAFQNIGTDKMFVCAGVRKLSSGTGIVAELSVNFGTNNGAYSITANGVSGDDWYLGSRGTAAAASAQTGYSAPDTAVIAGVCDIATDICRLRRNGTQIATTAGDQGTGNYGNYAMYFGRRAGTSLPYNGLDFGFVICGKTLTSTQIANTERWMSYRTGVTL